MEFKRILINTITNAFNFGCRTFNALWIISNTNRVHTSVSRHVFVHQIKPNYDMFSFSHDNNWTKSNASQNAIIKYLIRRLTNSDIYLQLDSFLFTPHFTRICHRKTIYEFLLKFNWISTNEIRIVPRWDFDVSLLFRGPEKSCYFFFAQITTQLEKCARARTHTQKSINNQN